MVNRSLQFSNYPSGIVRYSLFSLTQIQRLFSPTQIQRFDDYGVETAMDIVFTPWKLTFARVKKENLTVFFSSVFQKLFYKS
jgi:hypothetical protein